MRRGGRVVYFVSALVLLTSLASAAALSLPSTASVPEPAPVSQASSAPAAPAPRVVEVREASSQAQQEDYTGAIALVTVNRAFGDALYDDNALIDSVEITLLDSAVEIDGFRYLEQALVRQAVRQRYGREVSPDAGVVYGMEPPEGYYAILPRSYDYHEQTVTAIEPRPDGTLRVTSELLVLGLDSSDVHRVETILSPAQTEYGYIISSAAIVD